MVSKGTAPGATGWDWWREYFKECQPYVVGVWIWCAVAQTAVESFVNRGWLGLGVTVAIVLGAIAAGWLTYRRKGGINV